MTITNVGIAVLVSVGIFLAVISATFWGLWREAKRLDRHNRGD